jgi:hypothetical protein
MVTYRPYLQGTLFRLRRSELFNKKLNRLPFLSNIHTWAAYHAAKNRVITGLIMVRFSIAIQV